MKKTIKAELVSLAHKILQLRDTTDYGDMAIHARALQEKLTILAYAEKLEHTGLPTIGLPQIEEQMTLTRKSELPQSNVVGAQIADAAISQTEEATKEELVKTPAEILADNQARFEKVRQTEDNDRHRPDGTQYNQEDPLHEPVIEKIKDMWPEMTPEAADLDKVIESIIPQSPGVGKNDSFEIGNEYQMPIFEPKETATQELDEKPKNLNDRLNSGKIKIGLNDKLSFIKHLFDGSSKDYNRVLSQLETFQTLGEAQQFLVQMIKPDYRNWEGKEVQEERFIQILESRYS